MIENSLKFPDLRKFLEESIDYYMKCLIHGEAYNIRAMFRLVSLWFDNHNRDNINQLLKKEIRQIPARKFIPLLYQVWYHDMLSWHDDCRYTRNDASRRGFFIVVMTWPHCRNDIALSWWHGSRRHNISHQNETDRCRSPVEWTHQRTLPFKLYWTRSSR